MGTEAVTHEQLKAGQMALLDRFDAHVRDYRETSSKLFEKFDKAIEATHQNSVQIASMQASVTSILEARGDHVGRLGKVEEAVAGLKLVESKHQGERGVIAALLRSPFVMALGGAVVGASAAIWAALKSAAAAIVL